MPPCTLYTLSQWERAYTQVVTQDSGLLCAGKPYFPSFLQPYSLCFLSCTHTHPSGPSHMHTHTVCLSRAPRACEVSKAAMSHWQLLLSEPVPPLFLLGDLCQGQTGFCCFRCQPHPAPHNHRKQNLTAHRCPTTRNSVKDDALYVEVVFQMFRFRGKSFCFFPLKS